MPAPALPLLGEGDGSARDGGGRLVVALEIVQSQTSVLAGAGRPVATSLVTAIVVAGMALAMQTVFVVAALAPFLIAELSLSRSSVGLVVTASYVVTVACSLVAGHLADVYGGRRTLLILLVAVSVSLVIASVAPDYALLLAAAAVAGVAQALSLPATNRLVAIHVPGPRQSAVVGFKQSGVQLAALVAGLLLPSLAAWLGWRGALRLLALAPLLLLVAVLFALPREPRPETARLFGLPSLPRGWVLWLMAYSFCIGAGTVATNTFLPLYANQGLHLSAAYAGVVLALVGISGVPARIAWAIASDRMRDASLALAVVAGLGVGFALLVWQAVSLGVAALWIGALGLGASAVAGNTVSTLMVVRRGGSGGMGQLSALVGLSFFAGFVVSPPAFGALTDASGSYGPGWLLVSGWFAVAALLAGCLNRFGARVPA
jgi:predicted MFS family arabinose efflux permease